MTFQPVNASVSTIPLVREPNKKDQAARSAYLVETILRISAIAFGVFLIFGVVASSMHPPAALLTALIIAAATGMVVIKSHRIRILFTDNIWSWPYWSRSSSYYEPPRSSWSFYPFSTRDDNPHPFWKRRSHSPVANWRNRFASSFPSFMQDSGKTAQAPAESNGFFGTPTYDQTGRARVPVGSRGMNAFFVPDDQGRPRVPVGSR